MEPHITPTGMAISLPQGLVCSCSNKEKKLQQAEVSVFRFALSLAAPCHSRELLVQDLSQVDAIDPRDGWRFLFLQIFNSKNKKPTNKNLPQRNFCKAWRRNRSTSTPTPILRGSYFSSGQIRLKVLFLCLLFASCGAETIKNHEWLEMLTHLLSPVLCCRLLLPTAGALAHAQTFIICDLDVH